MLVDFLRVVVYTLTWKLVNITFFIYPLKRAGFFVYET